MRLNIHMLGTEEFLGTIDGEILNDLHTLAAAVVPPSRISFGILVRKDGSGRLEHGAIREVFRCNQLQAVRLATLFVFDGSVNFRIEFAERSGDAVHMASCSG